MMMLPEYLYWIITIGHLALGFAVGWTLRGVYEKHEKEKQKRTKVRISD